VKYFFNTTGGHPFVAFYPLGSPFVKENFPDTYGAAKQAWEYLQFAQVRNLWEKMATREYLIHAHVS